MKNRNNIAIIGTVGLPANYGGFETLADHIVRNMAYDYNLTVYCSGKRYRKAERIEKHNGARLVYLPFNANGIQSIIYDTIAIIHALFYADVLLVLGVAGAWVLPFVRLFTNKKIIISIDGIEWKRGKWNTIARIYLWWAEGIAVKYSHVDISDNESIQDYTALRYGSLSRIIEYGADHTMKVNVTPEDITEFPFLKKLYAFKVCRIEPENNVHVILEAFSQMPGHTLVVVGNWTNSEYGRGLRAQFGSFPNIRMMDPIYNQRTLDLLRSNAFVYIHGHSAGGTNPFLVEAMYLCLPVIAFNVSYNRTTTENKALYFNDAQSLKELITTTNVGTLFELAATMKKIALRRYTWKNITNRYRFIIEGVLSVDTKLSVTSALSSVEHETLIDLQAGHLSHGNLFFDK